MIADCDVCGKTAPLQWVGAEFLCSACVAADLDELDELDDLDGLFDLFGDDVPLDEDDDL